MMAEWQFLIADKSLSEIKEIIIDSNFPAGAFSFARKKYVRLSNCKFLNNSNKVFLVFLNRWQLYVDLSSIDSRKSKFFFL
jgi:hypothetical protein